MGLTISVDYTRIPKQTPRPMTDQLQASDSHDWVLPVPSQCFLVSLTEIVNNGVFTAPCGLKDIGDLDQAITDVVGCFRIVAVNSTNKGYNVEVNVRGQEDHLW